MQAKAVRRHQHFAWSQSWPDVSLEDFFMILVGNEDHNHIGLLCGLCRGRDTHTVGLGFGAALAAFRQPDHHIAAGILHVEGVRMSLAAITNHSYTFPLD